VFAYSDTLFLYLLLLQCRFVEQSKSSTNSDLPAEQQQHPDETGQTWSTMLVKL
jgi:hypothetical protein